MSGAERDVRARLLVRWGVGASVAGVAIALGTLVLSELADHPTALRWSVGAVVVGGFEFGFLYWHLGANRPEGGPTFETIGVANALTLVRGGLLAVAAGCVLISPDQLAPLTWLPAVCYGSSAALDWLDGTVARATGRVTVLGTRMDMAFDTVGFLLAPVVGVLWGQLPVWYLSLSAARYLFKTGTWFRRCRGLAVADLPESRLRRPLAGLQMTFITVALAPVVPVGPARIAAAVVLLPSLAVFLRDYLWVSGRWYNSHT